MTKDPVNLSILAACVSAVTVLIANLVTGWLNKPKIEADAQGIHAATEAVAITNAQAVIAIVNEAVAKEHAECQASIAALRGRINRLERALIDHNIPIPRGDQ